MVKVRLVALGTIVTAGALVFGLTQLKKREFHAPAPAVSASASASSVNLETAPVPAASNEANTAQPTTVVAGGKDYSLMPDGAPVPALPATAPRTCGFGAVLFTYEGAQVAPRRARTKAEAYALAKNLVVTAEQNFVEAVKKGDPGSLADAGSIGRGILERSVEYYLFTLEKGKVHPEPIETPRGYWILKRLR